jgi:hypothetical protein
MGTGNWTDVVDDTITFDMKELPVRRGRQGGGQEGHTSAQQGSNAGRVWQAVDSAGRGRLGHTSAQ